MPAPPNPTRDDLRGRRGRVQFGLAALLGATALAAVVTALLFTVPPHAAVPGQALMLACIAAVAICLAVFGRGAARAAGCGAVAPSAACLLVAIIVLSITVWDNSFGSWREWVGFTEEMHAVFRVLSVASWSCSVVGAVVGVATWSMVRPRDEGRGERNSP